MISSPSRVLAASTTLALSLIVGDVVADGTRAPHAVFELGGVRFEADGATVVSEKLADQEPLVARPAAGARPEEITVRGGATMTRELHRVLGDAFTKDCARRLDGSFVFADKDYGELSRVSFSWGVVAEVTFPALDLTSKEPAEAIIAVQPSFPRRILQRGDKVPRPTANAAWLRSGFRFGIDGLDAALKSTKHIGALRVTQAPSTTAPIQCTPATVSDLVFSLPTADAAPLTAWKEGARSGAVEYVAADGSPVARLKLVDLKKKAQSAADGVTTVTIAVGAVAIDGPRAAKP